MVTVVGVSYMLMMLTLTLERLSLSWQFPHPKEQ